MVHAIISWSLKNRLIVILGVLALVGMGIYSARNLNVEAYPGSDSSPGRDHRPEPGSQPRGDGAAGGRSARDRAQRNAGAGGPAQHVDLRADRHQVPVQLRNELLGGPAGGDQPDRGRRPAAGGAGPALALEPHRGDRPLRPRGPRVHDQSAQGRAGLGAQPRAEAGSGRDRRDRATAGP